MMANGNGNGNGNGWKNWVLTILIGILATLCLFGTNQIQDKADKKELEAVEARSERRDEQLRQDLKESVTRFEKTQNEIYRLLMNGKRGDTDE